MDQCANLWSSGEFYHKKQVTKSVENHNAQDWLMFSKSVREEEESKVVVTL